MRNSYEIIVVGAGHAGCEAALACARMQCRTLLITMHLDRVGLMSCNPAVGGVGKGQLVKEIDALGGEMAKAADNCGIQFRILNASKGPAVHSSRAQEDRLSYKFYIKKILEGQENLSLKEGMVVEVLVKGREACGVRLKNGERILSKAVIITPGTFLNGLIHIGLKHQPGGRIGEEPSVELSNSLKRLGFNILRFKTGTCARLDSRTIDFSHLTPQLGDREPIPFSFSTKSIDIKQLPCYITYTNKNTHSIIKDSLIYSPLYTGKIKATGVRYCPSIEDKIVRFPERQRHQIFLEPEGKDTYEYYPNGLSTSLPVEAQIKMLRSIEGLKKVEITRPGYGIEHDIVDPTQLFSNLETKLIKNLYLAGQINGTTGYEEAAAQGLIAGINAAQNVKQKPPLILDRSTSYIGVLIDDLVTKGTNEPYRMFTSRVEYRLLIREDNADLRLRKFGFSMGLVSKEDFKKTQAKEKQTQDCLGLLKQIRIKPTRYINRRLEDLGTSPINRVVSLEELLKRPQINFADLEELDSLNINFAEDIKRQVEIEVKYSGFIQRQLAEVEKFKNLEKIKIPSTINYTAISGLSSEIKEKLNKFKPSTLGQASRISGVTPVAVSLLMIYLRKAQKEINIGYY